MVLEFDSDRRLWRNRVCDVIAEECPPAPIYEVVDMNRDPAAPRRTYIGLGWPG